MTKSKLKMIPEGTYVCSNVRGKQLKLPGMPPTIKLTLNIEKKNGRKK